VSIVVDTSISLAWVFTDEGSATTEALLDRVRDEGGVVPALWEYEVCNALLSAVRRGRLSQASAIHLMTLLRSINLRVDRTPLDMARVMSLAATHSLSAYDAAYLDLAIINGLPLATLDQPLAQAATKFGIDVLPALDDQELEQSDQTCSTDGINRIELWPL